MRYEMVPQDAEGVRSDFLNKFSSVEVSLFSTDFESNLSKEEIRHFFDRDPCPYTHETFQVAARVFEPLMHTPREGTSLYVMYLTAQEDAKANHVTYDIPEFSDDRQKLHAFTLVFETLKFQRFLEDMLDECAFFATYPEFKEDMSLVMVMLCDFKQRKFQRRIPSSPREVTIAHLSELEQALVRCRTKLNAALARSRIKARVLSIEQLLPDSVRNNEKIGSHMHVSCWLNQCKTDEDSVLEDLLKMGFTEVYDQTGLTGQTYMRDVQCSDHFYFPSDLRRTLMDHDLFTTARLIIQDKSSCLGPLSVRALVNDGDDVLHVNFGSGLTTAHISSLLTRSDSNVFAVGQVSSQQLTHAREQIEHLGLNPELLKFYQEDFLQTDFNDERFKFVKVVLVTAHCSRSGVANPVNTIVNEGEDTSILRDLSIGYTDESKLSSQVLQHTALLKHALRFPRVQAVVYCTRSLMSSENEEVVNHAIEYTNMILQKKTPFRVAPPVIPLTELDITSESPLRGKFLNYMPSALMSGAFLATITREADDPKEAAKDILARAAARGIISGMPAKGGADTGRVSKAKSVSKQERKRSPRRSKSLPQKTDTVATGSPVSSTSFRMPAPPPRMMSSAHTGKSMRHVSRSTPREVPVTRMVAKPIDISISIPAHYHQVTAPDHASHLTKSLEYLGQRRIHASAPKPVSPLKSDVFPVCTQVLQTPFEVDVRLANKHPASMSSSAPPQVHHHIRRPPTPVYQKVIKHPGPFRLKYQTIKMAPPGLHHVTPTLHRPRGETPF